MATRTLTSSSVALVEACEDPPAARGQAVSVSPTRAAPASSPSTSSSSARRGVQSGKSSARRRRPRAQPPPKRRPRRARVGIAALRARDREQPERRPRSRSPTRASSSSAVTAPPLAAGKRTGRSARRSRAGESSSRSPAPTDSSAGSRRARSCATSSRTSSRRRSGPRVAERVWTAVRPTIAVYGEQAQTLLISTPGDSPLFGKLWTQASNGELGEGAAAFQRSTRGDEPAGVGCEFLEQERVLLGADFAREYEAEFVSGAHVVPRRRGAARRGRPVRRAVAERGHGRGRRLRSRVLAPTPRRRSWSAARARTEDGSWSAGSSAGLRAAREAFAVARRRRPSARRSRTSSWTAWPRSRRRTARRSSRISTSRGSWPTGSGNEASSGW